MNPELIVVLDVDTREEALDTVRRCGRCRWFKIGSQLFTRCGPAIVGEVRALGKEVMLDLKYHDIPNTVASAARAGAATGAGLMTLHALGGRKMVAAAREAVEGTGTRLLAVTILTSHSDDALRDDLGLAETAAQAVPRLARTALDAGAHGIVCSPQEIALVRAAAGPDALIVTPGVRPAGAALDDQQRVMTPGEAVRAGANMIVVGRPILRAPNPAEAVDDILKEINT